MAALAGCTNPLSRPDPLPAASQVDVDRFLGKWYVIGIVPAVMMGEPYNATETWQRADRGIRITYEFNANKADGPLKTVSSRATANNPGINTEWRVTRTWPFQRDLTILHIEPDYSVAVIGHPNRVSVRILARQPSISGPLYSDIMLYLQDLGYDVGRIRHMPHR